MRFARAISPATEPGRAPSRLLARKVRRDALALGGTAWSLVVLMLIGCGFYVAFAETRVNLERSYRTFYDDYHFADATLLVERAPEGLVDQVRQLPGVRDAIGRAVKDGSILMRDAPRRRVMGRMVGLPADGRTPINGLCVVEGRYFVNRSECVIEQQFAAANGLRPGDLITAGYQGNERELTVVGLGSNPEYIYPVPSKEAAWVSPQTFGVLWLDDDGLRQWLGLGRSVSEVHLLAEPGIRPADLLPALRGLGEPYGLRDVWDQAGQPSNRLLNMDLTGFRMFSVVFPVLFMFAAALSLYSALTRIVRLQTGVVGFLRSSGFTAREVLWHYVAQGGLIAMAGALPGAFFGHFVANYLVGLYGKVLHLPVLLREPQWSLFASGLIISGLVGALAAALPARLAARTPPAVAMRGDRGEDDGTVRFGTLMRLSERVPYLFRIAVRGLIRRPSRTLFAVGGLTCGTCVLIATMGMYISVKKAIDEFLEGAYHWELDCYFAQPYAQHVAEAIGSTDGIDHLALTCSAQVRVESARGSAALLLHGMEAGQQAIDLRDLRGRRITLDPGVLWLPSMTARRLKVEAGDPLRVVWAYSSRKQTVESYFTCGGAIDLTFGGIAYGEYHDVRRRIVARLGPNGSYGAVISCSKELGEVLQKRLEREPAVAYLNRMSDIREQIEKSMGITFLFMSILVLFGAVLSGAVMHSVASVGVLERLRELATLRSLGFSARQTTRIAAVEIYVMGVLGLVLGMPLGTWMNAAQMRVYETETFVFKSTMTGGVYLAATGVVFALVTLSLVGGVRRLRSLDLAQATKARE